MRPLKSLLISSLGKSQKLRTLQPTSGETSVTAITESDVEEAALKWLECAGWQAVHGPNMAPGTPDAERANYGEVVLERRLRDALAALNRGLAGEALDDAFGRLTGPDGSTLHTLNWSCRADPSGST